MEDRRFHTSHTTLTHTDGVTEDLACLCATGSLGRRLLVR